MSKITKIVINGTEYSIDGASAYEVARQHGFEGTEEEWLAAIQGTTIHGVNTNNRAAGDPLVNPGSYETPPRTGDFALTTDGDLYRLTVEGETITAELHFRVKGEPGTPGQDGAPGVDGVSPLLRVSEGSLWVSYDNGEQWTELGVVSPIFERDTSAFVPPNILEGLTLTTTVGAFWLSSGNIGNTHTSHSNYTSVNEPIAVTPGCEYLLPKYAGAVRYRLQNGTVTDTVSFNTPVADRHITAPEGATHALVSYLHAYSTFTAMYRTTMTAEEEAALPLANPNLAVLPENLKAEEAKALLAPLMGKTIVNFGDSIFGNARPPEDVSTRLAALTGATVHNCAFGGCRMAAHTGHWDAFSMYRLADAIATGDWSLQDEALNHDDRTSYAEEPLALLKSLDFSKVDIITIAYGTNDWNGGTYLDSDTNRLSTVHFTGSLRYSIEKLLTAFPHIRIFVCSPTYRARLDSGNNAVEDSDTWVSSGKTLLDFVDAVEAVSKEYKLPFIDNYHGLGINKVNRPHYFPVTDGTHHNQAGRDLLAAHIASKLF